MFWLAFPENPVPFLPLPQRVSKASSLKHPEIEIKMDVLDQWSICHSFQNPYWILGTDTLKVNENWPPCPRSLWPGSGSRLLGEDALINQVPVSSCPDLVIVIPIC